MPERMYLDASDVPRTITLDAFDLQRVMNIMVDGGIGHTVGTQMAQGFTERLAAADARRSLEQRCCDGMTPAQLEALGQGGVKRIVKLVRGLASNDDEPCMFDHHGDCQEHGCTGGEGRCLIADARELLAALAAKDGEQ